MYNDWWDYKSTKNKDEKSHSKQNTQKTTKTKIAQNQKQHSSLRMHPLSGYRGFPISTPPYLIMVKWVIYNLTT